MNPDGSENEVAEFKDAERRVKRQVARFWIFQFADDGSSGSPLNISGGTVIKWRVRLANKKDAVSRPLLPPSMPIRPVDDPHRQDRLIDSQWQSIENASAAPVSLDGRHTTQAVKLGEIRTDGEQRLLVFGGSGISQSPSGKPIANEGLPQERNDAFYNNPDWYDDVSDGPVTAEIVFSDGRTAQVEPAWVIVAPPDFAPAAQAITTLYDVILEVAVEQGWRAQESQPSFTRDIYSILKRARSLRWVHGDANWAKIGDNYADLANPAPEAMPLRRTNAKRVELVGSILRDFNIRPWQQHYLDLWVGGNFLADWNGVPPLATVPTPELITRAVLDGTAGQGFFPGIEGGRILTDFTLYSQPFDFRLSHAQVKPGDITALMAQPWQADFLECTGRWWPSQRPDLAPQHDGTFPAWHRPLDTSRDHRRMVNNVMRMGMIAAHVDATGQELSVEEMGRDDNFV